MNMGNGLAKALKRRYESREFVKKLFEKNRLEVLNIDSCDETKQLEVLTNKSKKEYFNIAMNLCNNLREDIIFETNFIPKVEKILHYTYIVCPILKIDALKDEWVQKGIKIFRILIISKLATVSRELRKGYKKMLNRIFQSMIPSLKHSSRKPNEDELLLDFNKELKRFDKKMKKKYEGYYNDDTKQFVRFGKKADLKELYPKGRYPFITNWLLDKFMALPKSEIIFSILARKYKKAEWTTMRDWIYRAFKNKKLKDSMSISKILSSL